MNTFGGTVPYTIMYMYIEWSTLWEAKGQFALRTFNARAVLTIVCLRLYAALNLPTFMCVDFF